MFALLHVALLEGSGSNLWTRSVIKSLVNQNVDVVLVCQENHPELYDFITHSYVFSNNNETITEEWIRDSPYPGNCYIYRPDLNDKLLVYVEDQYEHINQIVPLVNASNEEIDVYIQQNEAALLKILQIHKEIELIHVNHTCLLSSVAEKVYNRTKIPYQIFPHGSAIEYAVCANNYCKLLAKEALLHSNRILAISSEIADRLCGIYPEIPKEKFEICPLGVDPKTFQKFSKSFAKEQFLNGIHNLNKGEGFNKQLSTAIDELVWDSDSIDSNHMLTSKTLENLLQAFKHSAVDDRSYNECPIFSNNQNNSIIFVGRLIQGKGVHFLLMAFPLIFKVHKEATLSFVGSGPLRVKLEFILRCWKLNNRTAFETILLSEDFKDVKLWWNSKCIEYRDEYWSQAHQCAANVDFMGYIPHKYLRYLYSLSKIAVFPSVVKEAGPLVFLEAQAVGVPSIGINHGGAELFLNTLQNETELAELAEKCRIPLLSILQINEYIDLIAEKSIESMNYISQYPNSTAKMRDIVLQKHDWNTISKYLANI
eukprot:TRINITY_DN1155_c0_g1_i1.p1 TRINITY_DN1155_c0_g1~~TRINITY_DN1155_c0_g1_i1.p1  ORF type:complete len:539 (+),score=100.42 TRINITY_DN1155_c0_g1_i1:533-2149(+)